jgi:Holliday junction resolvasome RuvABC endonuclease subunit
MTFIDEMPAQETWQVQTYAGFDPDLHAAGLAVIKHKVSSFGRRELVHIDLFSFTSHYKLKGIDAAQDMIQVMWKHQKAFQSDHAIVEGQQAYYRPDDSKSKIVGQANDLLMLGLVSGAAAAIFLSQEAKLQILKPADWKGQIRKDVQQDRVLKFLAEKAMVPERHTKHNLDALCMALTGAGYEF